MTDQELLRRYMAIRLGILQGLADLRVKGLIGTLRRDLMAAKPQMLAGLDEMLKKIKAPRDAAGFFDERADALAKYVAGVIAKAAAEEGVEAFEGAQSILSVDGHARNVRLARGLTAEQFEQ
ncbi:MAG: hypothetical protein J5828_01470, partial [Desulfovibrionaceae bacterium]|nr:hypothetical protein [Desulfovibrionaceae bacterium]